MASRNRFHTKSLVTGPMARLKCVQRCVSPVASCSSFCSWLLISTFNQRLVAADAHGKLQVLVTDWS